MSSRKLIFLTALTLLLFAANSVLGRLALAGAHADAASFTALRLVSGALFLVALVYFGQRTREHAPAPITANLLPALYLFAYAACFSFAYLHLDTGAGALLLFGAVQFTMFGHSAVQGQRFSAREWLGIVVAVGAFSVLYAPDLRGSEWQPAVLMMLSGLAWGAYTLAGKRATNATLNTRNNFVLSVPPALVLWWWMRPEMSLSMEGIVLACVSGALSSAGGYALWYAVVPYLQTQHSALLQLSVPVLATLGGVLLLGETVTLYFVLCSSLVLTGIAITLSAKPKPKPAHTAKP